MSEPRSPWQQFARAPLVPVAVAAVVGLCVDRGFAPPLPVELLVGIVAIIGWTLTQTARTACALVAVAAVAAAYHHTHRHSMPADDIGHVATPTPTVVVVRGIIDETPVIRHRSPTELYGPPLRMDRGTTVLAVTAVRLDGWQSVSGLVRLTVERPVGESDLPLLAGVRPGDEVEVIGLLSRPGPPGNPGEFDYPDFLRDRRIRAELRVTKSADGLTRLSPGGWTVARLRELCAEPFAQLPADRAGLARALLLGDTAATDRDEWDAFARTGTVHVLAISGQHLVIVAGAVWLTVRLLDVRRKRAVLFVVLLVVGYAILTGLRPSAVRAAVMVSGAAASLLVNRPPNAANSFAASLLAVIVLDPTDPFTAGCQFSFVAVFVLVWGVGLRPVYSPHPLGWQLASSSDRLDRLEDEFRPEWVRVVRGIVRGVAMAFVVNAIITAVLAPLLAWRTNVVPPVGVLVGPPLILLTTLALMAGFAAVVVGVLSPVLGSPFVVVTGALLALCDRLVHFADAMPGGSVYVPAPPGWWVAGFYLLVAVGVLFDTWRKRILVAVAVWLVVGLVRLPAGNDELRVTFLSVGHGGCAVLETPDGRVLVYDAGSTLGSDAVRRIVAPYLWSRGITRIDELFVSHADLDHFNGVPELMRRFPVGRLTLTPSFASKPTAEVAGVLAAAGRYRVPVRTVSAGDSFTAGAVAFEVLHPPAVGPPGIENERSLVLLATFAGRTVLLTGDLEKAGSAMLLAQKPRAVDVLTAPHHGSRGASPRELAAWATPGLVVVSKATRDGGIGTADVSATVWDTPTTGAVTVRVHATGVTAEAFKTGERLVVRRSVGHSLRE